jgi:glycosyltransferase involved in cell wall biosynthesis
VRPRLVYFSTEMSGGLVDYAHEQAEALHALGVDLHFLTMPGAMAIKPEASYRRLPILADPPPRSPGARIVRRYRNARWILGNVRKVARYAETEDIRHVLFGSYFEYLAPIWSGRFRGLARKGFVFGAVVHDPVRDVVVGPPWWHRWSIASGYSFLREAFVHEPMELQTVKPMPQLRTTVIPHGPYMFPPPTKQRAAIRQQLGIPENANLLLAFGLIRDTKNLDLVIEAMREVPEVHLLVAGRELSGMQKPVGHYQALASRLGVAGRCHWDIRHIPENEVGNYFEAADLVLLTYGGAFSSASGVLNAAVNFRKPCLASSGRSNLRTVVEKYSLGYWVEPDSAPAIVDGLRLWLRQKPSPGWDRYHAENSWRRNAELVADRMSLTTGSPA